MWKSGLAALSILSSTGKSRERSSAFPPSRSMPEVEANPLRILVCYDGEKYLHAMPPRNCHEKRTNNLVLFWIASYQELHLKAAHHLFLEPCKTYKRELMIDTLKPSSVVPGSKTWVLGRCVWEEEAYRSFPLLPPLIYFLGFAIILFHTKPTCSQCSERDW